MTTNQVGYWNMKENERANQARELETNRSNLAKEAETVRSNKARELETERANKAAEKYKEDMKAVEWINSIGNLAKGIGSIASGGSTVASTYDKVTGGAAGRRSSNFRKSIDKVFG